jgi:hypothetical protein
MQPWAAMIIRGEKAAEHRTWVTGYRGRLWIHAGRGLDPDAPPGLARACVPLVYGAIIGYADLYDIDGVPGDRHWHLRDPVALDQPVPCRGWPGLWPLPASVAAKLTGRAGEVVSEQADGTTRK